MKIALDAAKFTPAQAEPISAQAMATFRSRGTSNVLQDKWSAGW